MEYIKDKVEIIKIFTVQYPPPVARDISASQTNAEYLAFIDNDAYNHPDWVDNAMKVFKRYPDVAVVCGPGVTPKDSCFREKLSGWVYELLAPRWRYFPQETQYVDDIPTCNFIIRHKDFDAVGGFGCNFWPGEDTYLCRKLKHQGYKMIYDPTVVVYHRRRKLLQHLRQIGRYGKMRGKLGGSFYYFIPAIVLVFAVISAVWYSVNVIRGWFE